MPGEAGLDECYRDVLAIDKDSSDEAAIPICFFDPDGDGLAEDQARGELLCFGAEGLAGFGAVDAFEADLGFLAGAEDLNSVAISDPDALAGEGLGEERRWRYANGQAAGRLSVAF